MNSLLMTATDGPVWICDLRENQIHVNYTIMFVEFLLGDLICTLGIYITDYSNCRTHVISVPSQDLGETKGSTGSSLRSQFLLGRGRDRSVYRHYLCYRGHPAYSRLELHLGMGVDRSCQSTDSETPGIQEELHVKSYGA
jgi:hypothetical protein